jgi:hypothetical protein
MEIVTDEDDDATIYTLGMLAERAGDPHRPDVRDHVDRGGVLLRLLRDHGFIVIKQ